MVIALFFSLDAEKFPLAGLYFHNALVGLL
jgi:hypothetical protein